MALQVLRRSRPSGPTLPEHLDLDEIQALGDAGDRMIIAAALSVAAERGLMPDGHRLARIIGPQTDAELLEAVEKLTGYHIPRVAVCTEHGHKSPAQTFCDLYFERVSDVLWIGNRGGGKTTNSGFLHGAKSYWLPHYTTAMAGAQAHQGQRGYAEFKRFIRHVGAAVLDTLLSKTTWANGSFNEVLGGTERALNGPHPVFAQLDEAELIQRMQVFQEFLNMAQSTKLYKRQQLLTSTRKRATGIVQKIVKEVELAQRNGDQAPWRVDIFCVFETMARVPNCRNAPENLDRPQEELCGCHRIVKGEWGEDAPTGLRGKPRTFADVCGGKAARSDGFVELTDVWRRFSQLSQSVWEAQQQCLSPDIEGLVHKWVKDKHRLPYWIPWPELGPVYRGWDWGGQNPHAIVWAQRLSVAVGLAWQEVAPEREGYPPRFVLTPIMGDDDGREAEWIVPAGAFVFFDEIYGNAQRIGEFSTLGLRAVIREQRWRNLGVGMTVSGDFCDPAGYIAKREVKKAINGLIERLGSDPDGLDSETQALMAEAGVTVEQLMSVDLRVPGFSSRPAPRYESIRKVIEHGEDDMVYYVPSMCPGMDDELDVYHWLEQQAGKNVPEDAAKEDDHAMDAKRYLIWGVDRQPDAVDAPSSAPTRAATAERPNPYAPPPVGLPPLPAPGADAPVVASPDTGPIGVRKRDPYGGRLSQGGYGR